MDNGWIILHDKINLVPFSVISDCDVNRHDKAKTGSTWLKLVETPLLNIRIRIRNMIENETIFRQRPT